ncbi:type II CAAX prenyl endopeptidase Rce1 family protein [Maricaulis sp.]|uniref:CPBP family glutamic-type intramembrane protease n=1 Tax=Maricaulis sp. TaxID=1486257 RepID=UPI003A90ED90
MIFALVIGTGAGLFTFARPADWPALIITALIAIIIPALAEEMVFRVLIAGRRGRWRAGLALILFVLWHPAQLWLGLPLAQPVFANPAFLTITAALGLACTLSWRRSGSIWPAVAMHWAVVVVWKGLAGG